MKRRLILIPGMTAVLAVAALVACVTVNVYFPAAEIKDLSRKIEEEVQKQAARNQEAAGGTPDANGPDLQDPSGSKPRGGLQPRSEGPGSGSAPTRNGVQWVEEVPSPRDNDVKSASIGLFETLIGVTPVYAQSEKIPAPDVTSPAIRKIIESRAARVDPLNKSKAAGVIGENNTGLVEVLKLDALKELKDRAEVQRLVKAENADREELYREIAVVKKVDPSQIPKLRETYAATLRDLARSGDWIQTPDGTWKQK